MEKQKLPNSTLVLIFGILSLLGCCCWGIPGIIFAIIALYFAKKDTELYNTDPSLYSGFENIKAGRILAIIGIVLSLLVLIYMIYIFVTVGFEGYQLMIEEMQRSYESGTSE
ncbi:DUF4190 domain-containing protein [Aquimarina sp. ERC-38]|uniref:CCC motif membrane protein n=1 Tax=Aquimarina sp. ERC-38 TaxID=2949996 RepID=UPI0022472EC3|nr:CCC motif membrane protein [Aquimarina sp. ERC-38]UZO79534.1 DUF4190 domain-containing protein [Aquimarina sp. ERC-38]